jgi:hypothetical protein
MRVLLDECVSEGLRNYPTGHDCQTARYAGFAGLENGQLLTAAETAKFDVVLTVDRGFEYQQNVERRKIRGYHYFVGSRYCWKTSCPWCLVALTVLNRSGPGKLSGLAASEGVA